VKSETFLHAIRMAVLVVLATGTGALAQAPTPRQFSGLLNDYTLGAGPYEMRGSWSVTLDPRSATGDFSAAMNMVHSDYYVVNNPSAASNDTSTGRNPHTHHITMKAAALTENVNGCEIQLVGPASVTLNGGAPPFDPMLTMPSEATVCITGGVAVQYANITLTFESDTPAAGHFGSQPIHGVIRKSGPDVDVDHHGGDHQDGRY
jgi:hypothetical protein